MRRATNAIGQPVLPHRGARGSVSSFGGGVIRGIRSRPLSPSVLRAAVEPALLRGRRPPLLAGVLVTVVLAALWTVAGYPLKQIPTVSSLGVVYLLGVVVVATFWGLWLGIAMAILSAAAFNFFHLPPVDRFTISDSRNWVALGAFVVAALASSTVSEVARVRAVEANRRRVEAD